MSKSLEYHPREKTIGMVKTRLRTISEATRLLCEMTKIEKHQLTTDDLRIIAEQIEVTAARAKLDLLTVRPKFSLGGDDA